MTKPRTDIVVEAERKLDELASGNINRYALYDWLRALPKKDLQRIAKSESSMAGRAQDVQGGTAPTRPTPEMEAATRAHSDALFQLSFSMMDKKPVRIDSITGLQAGAIIARDPDTGAAVVVASDWQYYVIDADGRVTEVNTRRKAMMRYNKGAAQRQEEWTKHNPDKLEFTGPDAIVQQANLVFDTMAGGYWRRARMEEWFDARSDKELRQIVKGGAWHSVKNAAQRALTERKQSSTATASTKAVTNKAKGRNKSKTSINLKPGKAIKASEQSNTDILMTGNRRAKRTSQSATSTTSATKVNIQMG